MNGCIDVDRINGKLLVPELANLRVLAFSTSGPLPITRTSFGVE